MQSNTSFFGANGIMEILQSKIAGGNLAEVKDLFSGGNLQIQLLIY